MKKQHASGAYYGDELEDLKIQLSVEKAKRLARETELARYKTICLEMKDLLDEL